MGTCVRTKLGPQGCLPGASRPLQPLDPTVFLTIPAGSRVVSPVPPPPIASFCYTSLPSFAEMSTEGSKYINKEIKNALKGVKQIKTLIEHTNDERKSLLGSLEEAKKKKEVRKSQVAMTPL